MNSKTTKTLIINRKLMCIWDIPDDIINEIFEYIGDVNETEIIMANKYQLWRVKSEKYIKNWYVDGVYCHLCRRYIRISGDKGLKRHLCSKNHLKKVNHEIKTKASIIKLNHLDLFTGYAKNISKLLRYNKNLYEDLYRNIHFSSIPIKHLL
jgi:hypothetical protein